MKETLERYYSPVQLLAGKDFVERKLWHALHARPYDVVQFFSHAVFSRRIEDSFIATHARDASQPDDGRLDMHALAGLFRYSAPRLLVLSACETAAGHEQAGLGLSGVAFQSGSNRVVATLWPIREDVAYELLSRFYDRVARGDSSMARALAEAQRAMIAKRFHPRDWAPFLFIGNWR